jgi:branched-chain amino acid transport system permease protein
MENTLRALRKNQARIIVLVVLVILFVVAVRGMSAKDWIVTTLRGLAVGAVTFLVASGLSLILGLMDVLNLAHGTMFMIGAYVGWSVYVRPDTFVDLLTPLLLLFAGFLLMPLWERLLSRLRLPTTATRIWPWVGLALAVVLFVFTFRGVPLSIWDPEVYDDSPIVWTQNFDRGLLGTMIQPAESAGMSPIVGLLGVLLASVLLAISLAGFAQRRGGSQEAARAPMPWRAIGTFLAFVVVAIVLFAVNTPLTNFLLQIDTTWLFLLAVVIATLTGAGLGGLMESTLIRPLYARPIYQLMLTLGLGFIGTEVVRALWGRSGFTMPRPSIFAGTGEGCPASTLAEWLQNRCSTLAFDIAGETARIRVYNEIFILLIGLIVLVVVWLLIQRSRLGMIIRAGVQDSEMVEALGINVRRVFTLVFALGVGLASLGGVLSGPFMGLSDALGANLLLGALIALAIGGLTSFPGAAAGALLVGLLQQFIIKYGQIGINLPFLDKPFKPTPPLVPASTVLLMVIILLVMPQGLLGRKE